MLHRDGEEEQPLLEAIRDGRAWKLLAENIPLLLFNHFGYHRQDWHPERVHSYAELRWQKWPVVTIGSRWYVTWYFVTLIESRFCLSIEFMF